MDHTFTFMLLKSHMARRPFDCSHIWSQVRGYDLTPIGLMRLDLTPGLACRLYQEHEGRDYYARLLTSVTHDTVTVALVRGENAVTRLRALLGPTDPSTASSDTIRGQFGSALPDNVAHASDSPEAALREARLFYADTLIFKV